jgi:hypothetical protein
LNIDLEDGLTAVKNIICRMEWKRDTLDIIARVDAAKSVLVI